MYTKEQLINQWLAKYPEDASHPDLEHNALAGHVYCLDGNYRDWDHYVFYREKCTPIELEKLLELNCPF